MGAWQYTSIQTQCPALPSGRKMQYTKIRLINISSGDNAVLLFADDAFLFFALLVSSSVSVAGSEDECMIDQDHG